MPSTLPTMARPPTDHDMLQVSTSTGLRGALVRSRADLEHIKESAVAARRTGTSTEHDQSSRSHALFKLEVR